MSYDVSSLKKKANQAALTLRYAINRYNANPTNENFDRLQYHLEEYDIAINNLACVPKR